MSSGPGRVQRAIIHTFTIAPGLGFTTHDLARAAYPGEQISLSHIRAVNCALKSRAITERFNLRRCRAGHRKTGGWRHVWKVA